MQVIVAAGSGLRNLRDLEGRMIAFDRPESLGGYVLPHAELKARGVRMQPLFTGPVDGLALLQFGRVDAAVATESFLSGALAPVAGSYRVLSTSPPLPDLALMASGRVAPEDIAAVAKAFVELGRDPKGRSLLERNAKRVGGSDATFIASDGSEYFADPSLSSIFAVHAPSARREAGGLAKR